MSSNTGQNNKPITIAVISGMVIGVILTFFAYSLFAPITDGQDVSMASAEQNPLYWVAPMDANYRRDKPGKSPMGMDLVPVYADDGNGPDEGVGTIRISSNVINNLGVRTAEVSYQRLTTEINTVGYVTYNEDKFAYIHPRVAGWIEKLYVKAVGDPIKKGQALYDIYSPELVNAQEELLLALARKNKQLIRAAEQRLSALQLPASAIENLKETRKPQQNITFYAPQNGVVEKLAIREGAFVQPETMMLSIVDLSEVWLKAEVFERQTVQLSMGDKVVMRLDYLPNREFTGSIEHIHPMLNANTRTAIVRLRFDNTTGELKPNMFAQITIQSRDSASALVIPKEALIRTGHQDRVVLALGQGSFKSVAVDVGRFDRDSVEILAGLNEGEKVVSSAQFLLDSESSKSSDFKRMNHDDMGNSMNDMAMSQAQEVASSSADVPWASATGTINSLMPDHGMINISRSAIEKWRRPAATVDFITDDNVSLAGLSQGMSVKFSFEIRDANFVIVEISPLTDEETSAATSHDEASAVDHSSHE